MTPRVQRFVARIKPHRDHPLYFRVADRNPYLFIGENDHARAQLLTDAEIRHRGWERMEFVDRATVNARVLSIVGAPVQNDSWRPAAKCAQR